MRLWMIPATYIIMSVVCAFALPRIEHAYFSSYIFNLSISSVQAYLSSAASGMMSLTAIVFSIAFVMVQFSAIAYSPRLVLLFARGRTLFHTLGIFVATFVYSLSTLAWVDRAGSGTVPLFTITLVVVMVIVSMILFSKLVQRLNDLQISNVLHLIGDHGREVIRTLFERRSDETTSQQLTSYRSVGGTQFGGISQTLRYSGAPRTVAKYNIGELVRQAQEADAVIEMVCAVGDTLVKDSLILRVRGATNALPEEQLMGTIHMGMERTFEQDPKYAIRLLVDVAIKALSPAINDPTTAVQTIDQIEDLLRRLGQLELDVGYVRDTGGMLRVIFPMPTWDDYLSLGFDEIRQFGNASVQVMRRLRSALVGLMESLTDHTRVAAVQHYLKHLDLVIEQSSLYHDSMRTRKNQSAGRLANHADNRPRC